MSLVLLVLFGLSTAHADLSVASAPAPFCTNPKAVICSQRAIRDDLGETFTNPFLDAKMNAVRAKARIFAKERFKALFANDDGTKLKKFARLVGYDGYFQTKCWSFSWTSETCRDAVADELSRRVLAINFETPDDTNEVAVGIFTFQKKNSLRLFYSLLAEPEFEVVATDAQALRSRETARPATRANAALIFEELRDSYIAKIKSWPIDALVKAAMLRRVRALKYVDNKDCELSDGIPSIYDVSAFNSPDVNTLAVCEGLYLKTNSPASLAMVIGHEISHAFDPCTIFKYERNNIRGMDDDLANISRPTGGLVSCLNRQTSKALAAPQCTSGDPTGELFADWAAAEVVPGYLQSKFPTSNSSRNRSRYAASYGILCGTGLRANDSHPSDAERINNIIFQEPDVRRLSGCPPPTRHCSFDSQSRTPAPTPPAAAGRSRK
jgi:hypothetical protein